MVGKNPTSMYLMGLYVAQKLSGANSFDFNNRRFHYFRSRYNITFANERTVEIPLIMSFLSGAKEILEIGNVLNHYAPFRHDVIDKYERAEGVINEDVCVFDTPKKYDLICSISTLEHVGWDEAKKNPNGMADAIANLRRLLAIKGKIVCTVPIGWNPSVDKLLRERPPFSEVFAFRRISRLNKWKQVQFEEISNAEFYAPFPFANAIVLGVATK